MRTARIERNTAETKISLTLTLEGTGKREIQTGCGFLDHMLTLFAAHGGFDLNLSCQGDTWVDDHHTVEDVGICLGRAFRQALGEMRGIARYGNFLLPMDETLVLCAVDLSGRMALGWQMNFPSQKVGAFDTELCREFWLAFVRECPCSLHAVQMAGDNTHHLIEAAFKGLARALSMAAAIVPGQESEIPSTKGLLG